jgi:hypothetical protein
MTTKSLLTSFPAASLSPLFPSHRARRTLIRRDGAPPPAQVIQVADMNLITIDNNDVAKFPLVQAGQIKSASELTATGTVFPDIAREIPVISRWPMAAWSTSRPASTTT